MPRIWGPCATPFSEQSVRASMLSLKMSGCMKEGKAWLQVHFCSSPTHGEKRQAQLHCWPWRSTDPDSETLEPVLLGPSVGSLEPVVTAEAY